MSSRRASIAAGAVALTLCGPALAGGDGSEFVNDALLGPEGTECTYCVPNPPDEAGLPFQFDWSLGLRGGVDDDGTGAGPTYQLIALPEFSAQQETIRGGYDFGLSGEIRHEFEGDPRIGSVTATAGGRYDLDELTTLEGRLNLTVSQDDPNSSDQPVNVLSAPLEISLDAEASASRDLGAFVVDLRGNAGRDVFGETVFDDESTISNEYQNTTTWGGGARLGYKLTPGLVAFVDGEANLEQYDVASPTLLVMLDNTTYEARTGLTFRPGELLELEGSVGVGYRDFVDETLDDFSAMLYGAKATFRPSETLTLNGELTTTIESPGNTSSATAKLEYAAKGDLTYQLNPWLRLRASAGWSTASYAGIDTIENKWGFGAGADYLLNANTDLTADYSFERSETTPAPATDEHQVMLGMRFHR